MIKFINRIAQSKHHDKDRKIEELLIIKSNLAHTLTVTEQRMHYVNRLIEQLENNQI